MMERLTFEGNFCEIAQCVCMRRTYDTACSQKQVWERLKAYEDTGLTPEQIAELKANVEQYRALSDGMTLIRLRELAVADKEGRVIVLPCKVGDTVWFKTYKTIAYDCIGIQPHEVTRIEASIIVPGEHVDVGIPVDQIGVRAFLSRAEAIAADAEAPDGNPILKV